MATATAAPQAPNGDHTAALASPRLVSWLYHFLARLADLRVPESRIAGLKESLTAPATVRLAHSAPGSPEWEEEILRLWQVLGEELERRAIAADTARKLIGEQTDA